MAFWFGCLSNYLYLSLWLTCWSYRPTILTSELASQNNVVMLLKCVGICRHFRHAAGSMLLLQHPICALHIGTWIPDIGNDGHPLALLRPNVSLSSALSLLLEG